MKILDKSLRINSLLLHIRHGARMKNTLVVLVVVCTIAASWISPVSAVLGTARLEVQGTTDDDGCLNGARLGATWQWHMELDKSYRYIFTRVSIMDCPSFDNITGLVFVVKNVGSLGNICARTGQCVPTGGGLFTCIGYVTMPSYDNGGTRCGAIHPVQYCLPADCIPDTGRDTIPPSSFSPAPSIFTHVIGASFPQGCTGPFDPTCCPPRSHLGNTVNDRLNISFPSPELSGFLQAPVGSFGVIVKYTPPTLPGFVLTCSQPSNTFFPVGTTVVTCSTVVNNITCPYTFDVVVLPPPPVCPPVGAVTPLHVLNAPNALGNVPAPFPLLSVAVLYNNPVLPGFTFTCVPPSASIFFVGTTTVACSLDGVVLPDGSYCLYNYDITVDTSPMPVMSRVVVCVCVCVRVCVCVCVCVCMCVCPRGRGSAGARRCSSHVHGWNRGS